MRILSILLVILIALSTHAALAARDTANFATCAALAGHPWEPGMAGHGVEWGAIEDTDTAILVCTQSLQEQPGEPISEFRLARTLLQVERYSEALPLLQDAAEAGYSPAQTALGTAYLTGVGAERNIPLAETWLKRAAAQGHPIAQTNLGSMYSSLGGVLPRNDGETIRLYRLAADQGYALAQASLGRLYQYAIGTDQNLAEAKRLLELAVAQNELTGLLQLGELLLYAPPEMSDTARAIDLLNKAAVRGSVHAHFQLGVAYVCGCGVRRDPFAARAHLAYAEAEGEPRAFHYLSFLYADDQGVGRDSARSFSYSLRAAEAGVREAMVIVGIDYQQGYGVERDQARAEEWLSRGALLGDPDAQYRIAEIWLQSDRADVRNKALGYAQSAGQNGLGAAFILLVDYYISINQWERALGYANMALETPGSEDDARLKIEEIRPKVQRQKAWGTGPTVG